MQITTFGESAPDATGGAALTIDDKLYTFCSDGYRDNRRGPFACVHKRFRIHHGHTAQRCARSRPGLPLSSLESRLSCHVAAIGQPRPATGFTGLWIAVDYYSTETRASRSDHISNVVCTAILAPAQLGSHEVLARRNSSIPDHYSRGVSISYRPRHGDQRDICNVSESEKPSLGRGEEEAGFLRNR